MSNISIVARPISAFNGKIIKKVSDTLIRIPQNGIKRIYDYCDNLIYKKVYNNMDDASKIGEEISSLSENVSIDEIDPQGLLVSEQGKFYERAYEWNQISKRPLTLENDGQMVSPSDLQAEIQSINPDITFEDNQAVQNNELNSQEINSVDSELPSQINDPISFDPDFTGEISEDVDFVNNENPVNNYFENEPLTFDSAEGVSLTSEINDDSLLDNGTVLDNNRNNSIIYDLFDYESPNFDLNSLSFDGFSETRVEDINDFEGITFENDSPFAQNFDLNAEDEVVSNDESILTDVSIESENIETDENKPLENNDLNREYLKNQGIMETDIIVGKNGEEYNAMSYLLGMMRELDEEKALTGENSDRVWELRNDLLNKIASVKHVDSFENDVLEELDNNSVKDKNKEYLESQGVTETDIIIGKNGEEYNAMNYLLDMMRELDEEKMLYGENSENTRELEGYISDKIKDVKHTDSGAFVDDDFSDYERTLIEGASGLGELEEQSVNDLTSEADEDFASLSEAPVSNFEEKDDDIKYVTKTEYEELIERVKKLEEELKKTLKNKSALKRERKKRKDAEKENESLVKDNSELQALVQRQEQIIEQSMQEREELRKIFEENSESLESEEDFQQSRSMGR